MKNPFISEIALKNSCYLRPILPKFEELAGDGEVSERHQFIHKQLRTLIVSKEFPCIGAKAAFNTGTYRFGVYNNMETVDSAHGICYDLYNFRHEQDHIDSNFTTFVACFENTIVTSEDDFEAKIWALLQAMYNLDKKFHGWDSKVSSDPDNVGFTYSFAERAYFIVGLQPTSSRYARKFAYPTLVFNAQYQFENLKTEGRFEGMKKVIRSKDRQINDGEINPNLGDLYEISAAGQYGTKKKDSNWKCPFHQ